jgi:8-oxo-dGTP pyrophosphatase MutT (NUDIX family)
VLQPGFVALARALLPEPPEAESSGHRAAVAAILREAERGMEVLFIRRALRDGDPWSGHIALPGGRTEPGEMLLDTARRETREEVGIDLERSATLIGRLADRSPRNRSDFVVRPYCFGLGESVILEPNVEVSEAFWFPLARLASGHVDTHHHLVRGNETFAFPGWDVGSGVVWGMTYGLIGELIERLGLGRGDG